jgi:hypothetical protein
MRQRDRVKKYMEDFGEISSFEAYKELGITQLGARIWELKNKDGIEIGERWEADKNRYGEPISYKVYNIKEV